MASLSLDNRAHTKVASLVHILLSAGACVNASPSETQTSALQAAIDNEHDSIINKLLDEGAEVNAHDPRFGTALSAVARRGKVALMKTLVGKGADLSLGGEKYG